MFVLVEYVVDHGADLWRELKEGSHGAERVAMLSVWFVVRVVVGGWLESVVCSFVVCGFDVCSFVENVARGLQVAEMGLAVRYCGHEALHAGRFVLCCIFALAVACCYMNRKSLTSLSLFWRSFRTKAARNAH